MILFMQIVVFVPKTVTKKLNANNVNKDMYWIQKENVKNVLDVDHQDVFQVQMERNV